MPDILTPQQRVAVENRGGKLLVSAAAGSGKTKVLVDRLMSYLTDPVDPADLDDFLIITYTKAAASELRVKISEKLTKYIAEHPDDRHMQHQIHRLHLAKISTVHGFCADILREYAYRLDIAADFRIAEENECQELMYNVLQQLLDRAYTEKLEDETFRAFVDTQGLGRDDSQVPVIILQIYSSALCHLDPDAWLDWCLESAHVDDLQDASETIWGAYLISDLKDYLTLQIQAFEHCIRQIHCVPGLEKPTSLLSATLDGLKSLLNCDTWDDIVNHPSVEFGTLTFKKEHKGTMLAEQIKAVRNMCKETLAKKLRGFQDNSKIVLSQLRNSYLASLGLVQLVREFKEGYIKLKKARRILDFSDIEQYTLDLLLGKHRTGVTFTAEEIASRYREIMVDEYQDSNEVQDAIFSALTHRRQNSFMVGDVKQSIYQFRLADPEIFLQKYNSYSTADKAVPAGIGRKVLLSKNFRSSNGVISAVNDVFTNCMSTYVGGLHYGETEMLQEGISHIALPDHEVEFYGIDVQSDTYQEEATFVAQRIIKLLDGSHLIRQDDQLRPITVDDIVILLRSPGSVGYEFRDALEFAGIPCTTGNDIDLLQTPEVETLRALLQVIHNPLQDIPLIAVLTSPLFCFTADDLAKIRGKNRSVSFYKAIENSDAIKAKRFLDLLNDLRMDARFLTVTQLIYHIFIKTDMLSIYGAMDFGEENLQNLNAFCQIASDFEATGRRDLSYFLEHLVALDEKGLSVSGPTSSGAVRIMSIHKSKGLEFPVVFMCGLSRSFNMSDIQKQVLCHKDLGLGLSHVNTIQRFRFPTIAKRAISTKIVSETISEELRVLYVAMTRARDRLIMTYAARKLEEHLRDIALQLDMSPRELLASQVSCPGYWILMTALQRTEAGEFFQLADRPDKVFVQDNPWLIRVIQAQDSLNIHSTEQLNSDIPNKKIAEKIRNGLSFRYPYPASTQIPSKLTATQMKGRFKDQEIVENAAVPKKSTIVFRTPAISNEASKGTAYGSAMHSVMQHLDYTCCSDGITVKNDIDRMVSTGLITAEQAALVDVEKIAAFFRTDIGNQILACKDILREFKFSLLEDASSYYDHVSEDQILIQGVVDCALIDDSGITVLDFKTDLITEDNITDKVNMYREQVKVYANALSKIFEKPIQAAYIYFFSSEQLIPID